MRSDIFSELFAIPVNSAPPGTVGMCFSIFLPGRALVPDASCGLRWKRSIRQPGQDFYRDSWLNCKGINESYPFRMKIKKSQKWAAFKESVDLFGAVLTPKLKREHTCCTKDGLYSRAYPILLMTSSVLSSSLMGGRKMPYNLRDNGAFVPHADNHNRHFQTQSVG